LSADYCWQKNTVDVTNVYTLVVDVRRDDRENGRQRACTRAGREQARSVMLAGTVRINAVSGVMMMVSRRMLGQHRLPQRQRESAIPGTEPDGESTAEIHHRHEPDRDQSTEQQSGKD
jgi:hypothetical protein